MTRQNKIEMRTQFATILFKIMKRYEPCKESWDKSDEETKRNEFHKMSEFYNEISELRDTLYKMNKYSEMLEDEL